MDKSTEAPVSMTFSITTKGGFNTLFTVRGESYTSAINAIADIEAKLLKAECKPQIKPVYGGKQAAPKEYANYPCPVCGSKVVIKNTKIGRIEECEKRIFDFKTKVTSGCSYIKYPNPQKPGAFKDEVGNNSFPVTK